MTKILVLLSLALFSQICPAQGDGQALFPTALLPTLPAQVTGDI